MAEDLPDEVIMRLMAFGDPRELLLVCQRWRNVLLLSPMVSCVKKLSRVKVLISRRNKGVLWIGKDALGALSVVRTLNLAFFNSGSSDGVPSSVLREICLLKNMSHPNIVSPRDAEFHGVAMLSIVFPFYDKSLRDLLFQSSQLESQLVRNIFDQICRGLRFLHSQGIVHRNIRPENLLIDSTLTVKIADFSACRRMHSPFASPGSATPEEPKNRTRTNKERQRLAYRAPELLMRCQLYSGEVDMWSAGVVLLELLLGALPWAGAGGSEAETLLAVFQFVGSPTVERWPEGPLRCRLWSARLPRWPGVFAEKFPDALTRGGPQIFENLQSLLSFPPEARPTAAALLQAGPEAEILPAPAQPRRLAAAWVGWMFSVGKILDAPSWCVWAAVRTAEAFFAKTGETGEARLILAASLKLAQRLEISRDYFRLNTCERLAAALPGATVEALLAAERRLLTELGFSIEIPAKPESLREPLQLFICDVAFVLDLPCRWDAVVALAPMVAGVWEGGPVRLCETVYSPMEMQSVLREVLRALTDFRKLIKEDLESFHESLVLPNLPCPAWPMEKMTAAIIQKREPESPREGIVKKRCFSEVRRRSSLSSERRKRRGSSQSEQSQLKGN